jgi:thioester reductase-like protein
VLNAVLLTGATGFLGAFLLRELLRQEHVIVYCLVRSPDANTGLQKIRRNLEHYEIWNDSFSQRIIAVPGDLSLPLLGLGKDDFHGLATQVDAIYHNGAMVNFIYPYSEFKETNVLGTQEVIRLACESRVKPVHFVSTIAVFNSNGQSSDQVIREIDDLPKGSTVFGGYAQSKWVAENLVMQARERGLPVCVYRPAEITGHSQTGVWNTTDAFCRIIKGLICLGKAPQLDIRVEMVPVDYASKAIVHLSQQEQAFTRVFHHLIHPKSMPFSELIEWIKAYGYPIKTTPYDRWLENLARAHPLTATDNLQPLIPMFRERVFEDMSLFETLEQRPKFDSQYTVEGLNNSEITCPTPQELLDIYFKYLINTGFLEPPEGSSL